MHNNTIDNIMMKVHTQYVQLAGVHGLPSIYQAYSTHVYI